MAYSPLRRSRHRTIHERRWATEIPGSHCHSHYRRIFQYINMHALAHARSLGTRPTESTIIFAISRVRETSRALSLFSSFRSHVLRWRPSPFIHYLPVFVQFVTYPVNMYTHTIPRSLFHSLFFFFFFFTFFSDILFIQSSCVRPFPFKLKINFCYRYLV